MKLTHDQLIAIIKQEIDETLTDLGLLLPLPLEAEPISEANEPKRNKVQLAQRLINTMTDREKDALFRSFSRFTWDTLLARFSEMKAAEKGVK